ncbi:MAG TPA: ABC transporter permease [Usitatibacter sp.]|nr:ABC transporter permease [Usitatibacter sp.]
MAIRNEPEGEAPRAYLVGRERLRRWLDSDFLYSLRRSPGVMLAAAVASALVLGAAFAPWVAPHNPFDLATLNLGDAMTPPAWASGGSRTYLLGTDDQGRDVLSAILFGSRISLLVGLLATVLAMVIGVALGLVSGYVGGKMDAFIMRVADVQLSFPAILIALLVDGLARAALPRELQDQLAFWVLVVAIAGAGWVRYARTVRGTTLVERNKEYVQAARVIGRHPAAIMFSHVLPNALGPVLVLVTLHIGEAIITEATLSFLGVGVPPTRPSLGTLVRIGNEFLFSGEWWITVFPAVELVALVLAINVLGDWLRDALNPRLR